MKSSPQGEVTKWIKYDSRINESDKIEVADVDFEDSTPDEIALDALQSKYVFAKVTVKVHRSSDPEQENKNKKFWWQTKVLLRK